MNPAKNALVRSHCTALADIYFVKVCTAFVFLEHFDWIFFFDADTSIWNAEYRMEDFLVENVRNTLQSNSNSRMQLPLPGGRNLLRTLFLWRNCLRQLSGSQLSRWTAISLGYQPLHTYPIYQTEIVREFETGQPSGGKRSGEFHRLRCDSPPETTDFSMSSSRVTSTHSCRSWKVSASLPTTNFHIPACMDPERLWEILNSTTIAAWQDGYGHFLSQFKITLLLEPAPQVFLLDSAHYARKMDRKQGPPSPSQFPSHLPSAVASGSALAPSRIIHWIFVLASWSEIWTQNEPIPPNTRKIEQTASSLLTTDRAPPGCVPASAGLGSGRTLHPGRLQSTRLPPPRTQGQWESTFSSPTSPATSSPRPRLRPCRVLGSVTLSALDEEDCITSNRLMRMTERQEDFRPRLDSGSGCKYRADGGGGDANSALDASFLLRARAPATAFHSPRLRGLLARLRPPPPTLSLLNCVSPQEHPNAQSQIALPRYLFSFSLAPSSHSGPREPSKMSFPPHVITTTLTNTYRKSSFHRTYTAPQRSNTTV